MHLTLPGDLLPRLAILAQVLLIDLMLAGDNAVVVGLAVAGLEPRQRVRAVGGGVAIAALVRIGLALVALRLLAVVGLTLAGGLLLLWVCWRMARELRPRRGGEAAAPAPPKTLRTAMAQIVLADLSMSLDNVLAVAGAAHGHPVLLATGLVVSVAMMALAASLMARLLDRYRWIAWVGLAVVAFVACKLIWDGSNDVLRRLM